MTPHLPHTTRATASRRCALMAALLCLAALLPARAGAAAHLSAHYKAGEGAYNFWLYLPDGYEQSQSRTPLIVFLHGASLCGKNLNSVRRYGPIDAAEEGRRIGAIIVAPQCPGGGWKADRVHAVVDWVSHNYAYNHDMVYVVGMSLGGYGTIDYCATYPDEVAAGIGMCGGSNLSASRQQELGKMPFWLIHGTADRAVPISRSREVASNIRASSWGGGRLRTTWLQGAGHGAPARVFYHADTYTWLFSHRLSDNGRPVRGDIDFTVASLRGAYNSMPRGAVRVVSAGTSNIRKYTDKDFDSSLFESITFDDIDFNASEFVPAGFDATAGDNSSFSSSSKQVLLRDGSQGSGAVKKAAKGKKAKKGKRAKRKRSRRRR